jgi:hypothetical protein
MVIADVEADLTDYADFEEVGSVARARKFVTAARRWLILRADTASNQSSSLTIGKNYVENMMTRATEFIAANSGNHVRHLGVGRSFR